MLIKKFFDTVSFRKHRDRKRLNEWYAHGQRGMSSEAVAVTLGGMSKSDGHPAYPHDSGDFMRCLRLVEHMQWEDRIHEMERFGGQWKAIASSWAMLTHVFYLEAEGNMPCGSVSAMLRHLGHYSSLMGFSAKNYASSYTRSLDLPGLYCDDREARGLPMLDEHYPIEPRKIGTHRWRVYLSWPEAQVWLVDANKRLTERALTGQLRASYRKAVEALATYVETQRREDEYHRRYMAEGSRY